MRLSLGSGTLSENDKAQIKNMPKGTKILMAVATPIFAGIIGFIIGSDFTYLGKWAVPVFILAFIGLGCITSFLVFIKPMLTEESEEYNEMNAREHAADSASPAEMHNAEGLPNIKHKSIQFGAIFVGLISFAFIGMILYAIIRLLGSKTVHTPTGQYQEALKDIDVLVCLIGGIVGLATTTILTAIVSAREYKINPQNAAQAEGVVIKSMNAGSIFSMKYAHYTFKVFVAVPSLNKILVARAKIKHTSKGEFGREYGKGEKVLVKYDSVKPSKCIIVKKRKNNTPCKQ